MKNGTRPGGCPGTLGEEWSESELLDAISAERRQNLVRRGAKPSGKKAADPADADPRSAYQKWLQGHGARDSRWGHALEAAFFGSRRSNPQYSHWREMFSAARRARPQEALQVEFHSQSPEDDIRAFGTSSENPDQLKESPVWDVYETLFPDEKERDAPEDIIGWLYEGWRNQGEWSEVFFTLLDNRRVIGMAYLSLLRPRKDAATRPKGWWFSNYFGILKGWRKNRKAGEFLLAITEKCRTILPESKGIIFEVERYSDRDIQSVLTKIEKRREQGRILETITGDEKYSVRAARRVGLYTGVGDRDPQIYIVPEGTTPIEKPFTRALSIVFLVDSEPTFVDYIQPAMKRPLDQTNEVHLWLMVYPMPGLDVDVPDKVKRILSPEEVDEIFEFVYGELYPSAYSRDYEGAEASFIDGFDIYVKGLRGRVQGALHGKEVALVAQNMLSREARKLIARYKRELDGMGLDL